MCEWRPSGFQARGFVYNVLLFCTSNHDMFSRKDVFTLFDGRLRIFTRKTNDEPRFEPRVEAREMGNGDWGAREMRGGARGGREGNACQETIVFLVFNIDQANVKILIGQSSKQVNHSLNIFIWLVEINITLLNNLIDHSAIIISCYLLLVKRDEISVRNLSLELETGVMNFSFNGE